jgi:phosphonate transport system substrate-binding protein
MHTRSLTAFTAALSMAVLFFCDGAFAANKPVMYFGVSLRFHPITMYERYQPMMDYLTNTTPYRFEMKVGRDYRETIRLFQEGKTDLVSIGDGGLMKAIVMAGGVPVVKPLNREGKPLYRSCFIVRKNSPIAKLEDLKGKRLALGYHHSTTGNLIPRQMLLRKGIKLSSLASVTNLRFHGEVARAVLKGEYDVGVVKESAAIRYSKEGLRVLESSQELPAIPLLVRRDAPPELARAVTDALVKLDRNNPQHRKVMEAWDVEYQQGFVPARSSDYRELMELFKAKPYGCGTGCHK